MSEICKYVIVDADDVSEDYVYDTLSEAKEAAAQRNEPVAIIERTYTFEDSELVWTSTGDTVWSGRRRDRNGTQMTDLKEFTAVWVNCSSHRAHDRIARVIGSKPEDFFTMPSFRHYLRVPAQFADEIRNIKGVRVLRKQPAPKMYRSL
jgi:hypothetical protein